MANDTTIDKKTFAVDMKLVWACAAALVYFANQAADWRNKVENHMAQQVEINKEIKAAPARIQQVENKIETFSADMKSVKESLNEVKDGVAGLRTSIARMSPNERPGR